MTGEKKCMIILDVRLDRVSFVPNRVITSVQIRITCTTGPKKASKHLRLLKVSHLSTPEPMSVMTLGNNVSTCISMILNRKTGMGTEA